MKEQIYNITADFGIWFLSKFFPEYFAKDPLKPTDRYIEYPFALKHIALYKPCKVIDVGCSGSMFPLLIKSLGHITHGIDIRGNYEGIIFKKGSITKTDYDDCYFDIVTAISTIEHIGLEGRYGVKKEDTDEQAINEIYRILRPNGVFIMTIPYGVNFEITKFHKIYNQPFIQHLLLKFTTISIDQVKSPEGDYYLGLIKAMK